ncbi:MAG: hypothetical protein ACT4SY_07105 [Hyphomicrobiales bacterium]
MKETLRTIGLAALLLGGLAAASPVYAHKQAAPPMGQDMMKGGGMDGMMGMMGMMEQMNKMMGLCTKMMETAMGGMGGDDGMKAPKEAPAAP